MNKAMRILIARKYLRERAKRRRMEKENESYQPKYRYGAIVRFTSNTVVMNGIVDSTHGTNALNALLYLRDGRAFYEIHVRPLTLREFFFWKDPATGMRRIGLMGWLESILITFGILGIFAMSFTSMGAEWAWVVRGLAGFMAGAVIVHTIREHRRMYRPPNPRTA
jgi:hypothetical protein